MSNNKMSFGMFDSFELDEKNEKQKEPVVAADDPDGKKGSPGVNTPEDTADLEKKLKDMPYSESDKETEEEDDSDPDATELRIRPLMEALSEEGVLEIEDITKYEDSTDGLLKAIQDTAEKKVEATLGGLSPLAKKLIDIDRNGGDIREAFEILADVSYAEIDETDPDFQSDLIRDYYQFQEWDESEIKGKLEQLEEAGSDALAKEAKIAKKYLVKQQDKERAEYEKSVEDNKKQKETKQKETLESIKSLVFETEDLGGFKLTKKDREKLFEHITKPVDKKTGETQLARNRRDPVKQLLAAYLDMIDYNVEDVERKAATKATTKLKQAISRTTDIVAKGTKGKPVEDKVSTKIPEGPWTALYDED